MDYKYYTAIVFDSQEAAKDFSESYHVLPQGEITERNTKYRFPVTTTEFGEYCTVIYDLNELKESDIPLVTIEKVNTDFIIFN